MQIISICFEYYYLYRCVTGPEFVEARRFDGFMVGAYCIHSMGFMVFVLLTSASVADSVSSAHSANCRHVFR